MNAWQHGVLACAACGLVLPHAPSVTSEPASIAWIVAIQNTLARPLDDALARVSRNGRYVALSSSAALTADDTNPGTDVYVLDLVTRDLTLASRSAGDRPSNGDSATPDISDDGRYVVFASASQNLVVPHETGNCRHVYLRDRTRGVTERVSATPAGTPGNHYSANPVISADGTTVAFQSAATDLVPGADSDANPMDVFLMRVSERRVERVSVASDGRVRRGQSHSPAISADGRFIVFTSMADLTTRPQRADTNRLADVYVRDTNAGTTTRISRTDDDRDPDGASYRPAISDDGHVVVFVSEATNLTDERGSRLPQIYAHDLRTGRTELVSQGSGGGPADGASAVPQVSGDAQVVIFQSLASNLCCARRCEPGEQDTNMVWDVFVHDRRTRRTTRLTTDGVEGWLDGGRGPSIDAGGTVATFTSRHPRSEDDTGVDEDLFVWRLR